MSIVTTTWLEVTLSSVLKPRKTKASPSLLPEHTPFIGLEHVEAHTGRITEYGRASDVKSAVVTFEAGDVLYSRLRPYLNKVGRPDFSGCASAEFIVLPGNERIDGAFLQKLLMQPAFVEFASHVNQGDRPRVDFEQISTFRFNLPPPNEQRRIVARLDALLARSKRARAELARVSGLVERQRQAVLAAAFSGELTKATNREKGVPQHLGNFIHSTLYGPRFAKTDYVTNGIPTLRTTDFNDFGEIALNNPPKVKVDRTDLDKWGLFDGDILVTRTGSIGKCALYNEVFGPALPSAYLIRVRLDTSRILPRYCLLFLLSRSGQEQLGAGITAVTQPNINAGVLRRLSLPVPSLTSQHKIVHNIESAFALIDRAAAEAERAAALLDRLDHATLARAFRGEL